MKFLREKKQFCPEKGTLAERHLSGRFYMKGATYDFIKG